MMKQKHYIGFIALVITTILAGCVHDYPALTPDSEEGIAPTLVEVNTEMTLNLGPKNICVNAVCAGIIRTPLVDHLFQQFAEVNRYTIEDYWTEENKLYARGSADHRKK